MHSTYSPHTPDTTLYTVDTLNSLHTHKNELKHQEYVRLLLAGLWQCRFYSPLFISAYSITFLKRCSWSTTHQLGPDVPHVGGGVLLGGRCCARWETPPVTQHLSAGTWHPVALGSLAGLVKSRSWASSHILVYVRVTDILKKKKKASSAECRHAEFSTSHCRGWASWPGHTPWPLACTLWKSGCPSNAVWVFAEDPSSVRWKYPGMTENSGQGNQ